MGSLNLSALATTVIRESSTADPHQLADELVRQIDPGDYREALRFLASGYMREMCHRERARVNGGSRGGSARVRAARDAWQRFLSLREYIPSTDTWIRLGDATRDQVLEMVDHRTRMANHNAAAAKRYQIVVDEMDRTGAAQVSELPDEVRQRVLEMAGGPA